jgi:hypothetical protein
MFFDHEYSNNGTKELSIFSSRLLVHNHELAGDLGLPDVLPVYHLVVPLLVATTKLVLQSHRTIMLPYC